MSGNEAPGGPAGGAGDDLPADPAAAVALVADQRARTRAELREDARLIFGAWGAAWLIGFGALWFADARPELGLPLGAGYAVFAAALAAALGVTTVHLVRRNAGLRGVSSAQGAMYGTTWGLAFAASTALNVALARLDADPDVTRLVTSVVPVVIVGALFSAGGALWHDRVQFTLGVWILVTAAAAALVGGPSLFLVTALAGGGGMLVAAGFVAARRLRDGRREVSA